MFRVVVYDSAVKFLTMIAIAGLVLAVAPFSSAQIHGVPSSVTSIGFGGNFSIAPGIPASVTSIGTIGFPPNCCVNPFYPAVNPNPSLFHHHHQDDFTGGGVAVYPVPYAVPVPVPYDDQAEPPPDAQYAPPANYGPPANYYYDKRGPAAPAPVTAANAAPAETEVTEAEPVSDQPETLLIFKDGHKVAVENYAIVGDTLFDLTAGQKRKIALAELDLSATVQQNDDRGIQFTVPAN